MTENLLPNSSTSTVFNRRLVTPQQRLTFCLSLQPPSRPLTSQNSSRQTPRAAKLHSCTRLTPRPTKQAIEAFFLELDEELSGARQGHAGLHSQLRRQVPRVQALVKEYQSIANAHYSRLLQSMREVLETLQEGDLPYSLDAQVRYIVNAIRPATCSQEEPPAAVLAHFEQCLAGVSAKQLQVRVTQQLRTIRHPPETAKLLIESFLILFCKADKHIEVDSSGNLQCARAWEVFQKYATKPGQAVQTLRQFPSLLQSGTVPVSAVKAAEARFRRVPKGTLPCLYAFLEACFQLHKASTAKMELQELRKAAKWLVYSVN